MSCLPQLPERGFETLRAELEKILAMLKQRSMDVVVRRRLLREVRMRLDEADQLMPKKLKHECTIYRRSHGAIR